MSRPVHRGSSRSATAGQFGSVAGCSSRGTAPKWDDGNVDPDPAAQAQRCFEIIDEALSAAGSSLRHVVRSRIYLVAADDFEAIGAVHGRYLGDALPANTTVVVAALLDPRWKVEIEVEAVIPSDQSRDRHG